MTLIPLLTITSKRILAFMLYGVRVFDKRVSVIINMNLFFLISLISSSESLVQLFVLF
ncbi:hypothetical protein Hanom_Chr01g00084971 [Helianthus anomalus]